jgi:hypothetical protein
MSKTKNLEIPVEDLQYLIMLSGGGDMVSVLTDKATWDSWDDQEDEMQFCDNIPASRKVEFMEGKDLVNFCVKHNLKIRNGVTGSLY